MLGRVSLQIRNDRQISRPLDRRGELALMSRAGSAEPRRKNLSLIGDESAERAVVLVIDPANAPLAKRTAFLWSSHCVLILVVVVIVRASRGLHRELFLAHRRGANFVLVQRDEITNDSVVELERALVFGQH